MVNPKVLSIAAIDPSGGAGLLSDIKTFMHFRLEGFGVATGITFQDEDEMFGVEWLSEEAIFNQLEPLIRRYPIAAVKIGMIRDLRVLIAVLKFLRSEKPSVQIIWDPVLSSSSGFGVHHNLDKTELREVIDIIDIVTPNKTEFEKLREWLSIGSGALPVKVLVLKGGHEKGERVVDQLIENNELTFTMDGIRIDRELHGTGCMFSAAMAACFANGKELKESFSLSHEYVRSLLIAADTKLAPQHLMV